MTEIKKKMIKLLEETKSEHNLTKSEINSLATLTETVCKSDKDIKRYFFGEILRISTEIVKRLSNNISKDLNNTKEKLLNKKKRILN